jgi:hypothetical protein
MNDTEKRPPAPPEDALRTSSGEAPFHAVQRHIGEALKKYYEPPRTLPHSMFTLLMQMAVADTRRTRRRGPRRTRAHK